MTKDKNISDFLSRYDERIQHNTLLLREVIFENLPDIIEQVDLPAKMIGYCYGQKYAELICVIIPSKKGLKLGFNRGTELLDPHKLLEGTGKISRYLVVTSGSQINSVMLKELLFNALALYQLRMSKTPKPAKKK